LPVFEKFLSHNKMPWPSSVVAMKPISNPATIMTTAAGTRARKKEEAALLVRMPRRGEVGMHRLDAVTGVIEQRRRSGGGELMVLVHCVTPAGCITPN